MPFPHAAHLAAIAALVIGLGPAAAQVQDERARLRERAAQLTANLPPEAQPNEKLVYRTTDQGKALSVWVYWPGGKKPQQPLPAIVLYHGGGWTTGTPVFYLAVARHFVERGMIAVLPEYRVNESSGSRIPDSTKDARAAMRWVKAHAGELGIDLKRLSAGGGSAGGQLAASLGAAKVDHPDEPAIDPRPEALVLFNPGLNFTYPAFADAGLKNNPVRRRHGARGPRRLRSDEEPRAPAIRRASCFTAPPTRRCRSARSRSSWRR